MTSEMPTITATCEFSSITNETGGTIMTAKFEDTNDNVMVASGDTKRKTIWLPHVRSEQDFVKKALVILSLPDQRVLGFLWNKGDDVIRFSATGYDPNAKALPGRNTETVTLTVRKDGSLRGD
jgi:hypothetical protein